MTVEMMMMHDRRQCLPQGAFLVVLDPARRARRHDRIVVFVEIGVALLEQRAVLQTSRCYSIE